jgi:hypothetical protein
MQFSLAIYSFFTSRCLLSSSLYFFIQRETPNFIAIQNNHNFMLVHTYMKCTFKNGWAEDTFHWWRPFIHLCILQFALRQVHSHLQSEFSTHCDIALLQSYFIISLLRSSSGCLHLIARLLFLLILHSISCFIRHFLPKMWPNKSSIDLLYFLSYAN